MGIGDRGWGWGVSLSDCEVVGVWYSSVRNRPSHFGFSVSEHADPHDEEIRRSGLHILCRFRSPCRLRKRMCGLRGLKVEGCNSGSVLRSTDAV
jgi:hypothetical protein